MFLMRRKRLIAGVLVALGALLILFGILWTTWLYPQMSKLPGDMHELSYTVGTIKVLDSNTFGYVTHNVKIAREFNAVKCMDDVIYLTEDITITDTDTDTVLTDLCAHYVHAVDRTTRRHIPGHGNEDREGYWNAPTHIQKDEVYDMWLTGNPCVLESKYVSDGEIDGLYVMLFELKTPEEGVTVPAGLHTPEQRMVQHVQSKIEPNSGIAVWIDMVTQRYAVIPVPDPLFPSTGQMTPTEMLVYEDHLNFAPEDEAKFLADAKTYSTQIPMAETTIPAFLFGLGGALFVVGALILWRSKPALAPAS